MIQKYSESFRTSWDRFVLKESCNGTFLQTRNFLDYHPTGKFQDFSLMFTKGNNIIAVMPANIMIENNEKKVFSHLGSTFGGIVIGNRHKKISDIEEILDELLLFLETEKVESISLKMTSNLYSNQNMDILDYFLKNRGFDETLELGYFVDLFQIKTDEMEMSFNGSRRRSLRKALRNKLIFRRLESDEEIGDFYSVLCNNMKKFAIIPLHSLDELLDFKNNRLQDIVSFYGVYDQYELIAGSMVFRFGDKKVFHTQYLAADQEKLSLYPSEYLYYSLIKYAKEHEYKYLSFGTATLDHGKVLNKSLAQFKEGFGTDSYVNRTYHKKWSVSNV